MDDNQDEALFEAGDGDLLQGLDDGAYGELPESEYDFGNLDALDSDRDDDEQYVEDDTLDPFTAAEQLERSRDGIQDDALDVDESINFTQRLLTNAQTLKQLRASGEPAVEIAYDEEPQDAGKTTVVNDLGLSQSFSDYRPTPSQQQPARSTPNLRRSRSSRAAGPQDRRRYAGVDRQIYDTVKTLAGEDDVVGKYETFPARALKDLPYHVFELVLERSRRYLIPREAITYERLQTTCLSMLALGRDLDGDTVFQVLDRLDENMILGDLHLDGSEPCQALTTSVQEAGIEPATGIRLLDFHFDYALSSAQTETSSESLGRALDSSTPELLRKLDQGGSQATVKDVSVEVTPRLVVVAAEAVDWPSFEQACRADADRRDKATRLYEREASDAAAMAEKPIEDEDGLADFPIELNG